MQSYLYLLATDPAASVNGGQEQVDRGQWSEDRSQRTEASSVQGDFESTQRQRSTLTIIAWDEVLYATTTTVPSLAKGHPVQSPLGSSRCYARTSRGQLGGPRRPSTCCSHFVSRRLNHYGAAVSLQAAFKKYSTDLDLLEQQSLNTRKMAEALFDRTKSYQSLSKFILKS